MLQFSRVIAVLIVMAATLASCARAERSGGPQGAALAPSRTATPKRSRYSNAEFDALLDQFYATIPKRDRNVVLGNIVRHITGQLVIFGLFYNAEATMIGNRLKNVATGQQALTQAWNAREWDLN
jgi:hypothetical protein